MNALVIAATAWALAATAFSLVALARLARQRPSPAGGGFPPVLLLRPVDAPTRAELEALAAPIDYPGPLEQVVVGPGFFASNPGCPNRKVGHLVAALAALPVAGRVVLSVDADVRVDAALVTHLAQPIARGAALSFAAPAPLPGAGLPARAVRALLCRTHHSFRALEAMSAGAKAVCGKAIGLGASAQKELLRLGEVAGEDLELSARLHAAGEKVVFVEAPAYVPQSGEPGEAEAVFHPVRSEAKSRGPGPGAGRSHEPSWREALDRFTRWMQVLKAHRPALVPAVPLLFAPSLPLLALAAGLGSWLLGAAVGLLWLSRAALAVRLFPGRAANERPWLDWVLGEALLLAAFARSLAARRLVWRGRVFWLRRGGRLVPA